MNRLKHAGFAPLEVDPAAQALRQDFHRPHGGVWCLILAAFGALVWLATATPPPAPSRTVGAPVADAPLPVTPAKTEPTVPEPPASPKKRPESPRGIPIDTVKLGPVPAGHARVAAIQFWSKFGDPEANWKRLEPLIEKTAALGTQIIVLPEACLEGRADMQDESFWTAGETDDLFHDVRKVAEPRDGPRLKRFAALAKKLSLYLAVPFIESAGGKFYNTIVLLDPKGEIILSYRKQRLVEKTDTAWATPGDKPPGVVQTPLGRIALLLGYDQITALSELKAEKTDILLNAAALYGHNFESLFRRKEFAARIAEADLNWVLANWSYEYRPYWDGYGMSRILFRDGKRFARVANDVGDGVVLSDVPITPAPAHP